MNPEDPPSDGWTFADMASIISGRDDARQSAEPFFFSPEVELSPGFHPEDGQYVVDPDFMELLGIEDPADLIRRKDNISR